MRSRRHALRERRGLLAWLSVLSRMRRAPGIALRPAVRIEDSVTPNFLVCLETGSRQVLLRRHLRETLRMTPEEYRDRWGLPPEYPMVAANYLRRKAAARQAERHG
ncbi:MucR family transcriptional regulator [Pseudooceanicola batsensis]|uniref:MucR family transcriptional regulator n=1 Tax=Pseudooceanicola batsensis TaxID=314255 RepID=UPI0003262ABD|nr:MucR family transcriptional regulator [Pseudooceanicola batsensis]